VKDAPSGGNGETVPDFFAYVLPQFHRDHNNDSAWGPGFSDWVTTLSARSLFEGQRQPKIPTTLGLYDLATPEAVRRVTGFAQEVGLTSLAVYHYWFSGERPLKSAIDLILENSKLPVFFCWVNESWKRTWFSSDSSTIFQQRYDASDSVSHLAFLRESFSSPNYFRVDGRPLLAVYRDVADPEFSALTATLGSETSLLGFVHSPSEIGPSWANFVTPFPSSYYVRSAVPPSRLSKLVPIPAGGARETKIRKAAKRLRYSRGPSRIALNLEWVLSDEERLARNDPRHCPGVLVGWDNTPRNGRAGTVVEGLRPDVLHRWVQTARSSGARLVGVFALNEWAEGAYFEPDAWTENAYSEALRSAIAVERNETLPLKGELP
jgi:Glycosyltransferase WbsX